MKNFKNCPICDFAESINTIIEAGFADTDVSLEELDDAKKLFLKTFSYLVRKIINEDKSYED